jgi:predicted transcriptional regulator
MATMTLNMDDRHMAALEALAAEQDMNKTQVMKQALRLYQLAHERAKDGQQLAFTKDGKAVPMLVPSMLPLLPVA